MILDLQQIEELILAGVDSRIALAREKSRHLNMHVTGRGMVDYLESLDSYETLAQKTLREKLAKSNKSTFAFLLRPTDKIFTAKGGAINYNLPQNKLEQIKAKVSDIAEGLDIKNYLKKVVKKHYIIDPNAILFCDINALGEIETHVITTQEIFWYQTKGNKVEAIIFAPYTVKDQDGRRYYRVIDGESDFIVYEKGGKVFEEPQSRLTNYFGFVPAYVLGDEKNPNHDIFDSIITDLIDDADILLRRMSINTVHELAHLYPRYWSYAQACTRCGGEGEIVVDSSGPVPEMDTCPSCGGSGQKTRTNPSDEIVVPFPGEGDPVIGRLMGYESPDINTARFYQDIIHGSRDDMFRAMWGTTYQMAGKRETATGRFIDSAPVVDRLSDISYSFSKMHKFLLDCYGKVIFGNPRYESSVTYGTRYIFEGPDDILKRYLEAGRENVSDLTRMDMMARYIEAEYKDDPLELAKRKKLSQIEPFPTLSAEKVIDSAGIPETMKIEKMLFPMWVQTLRTEAIVTRSVDDLREMFKEFVTIKTTINER